MKYVPLLLLIGLAACQDSNQPTALVKSEKSEAPPRRPIVVVPAARYGVEGFYTGEFEATKYSEDLDFVNHRITLCIDSLNGSTLFGHSVMAGEERPFEGAYQKQNDSYEVTAKEPGNRPTDGSFRFTIDPATKKLRGTWTANNPRLKVTERSYALESRPYQYDPSLAIPEDLAGMMMSGSFNEKTERAEAITADVAKKNASLVLLKSSDVENMYKADLEVLRNSIYARHGYSFKNVRMRDLFDFYVAWYMPVSSADMTPLLTEIEQKNVALIKRYEAHATKYYDSFGR